MEIYLEYALAENFLIDGALLYLAQTAAGQKVGKVRLCIAAAVGAGFALVFPYLSILPWVGYTLKFLVGILLCIIAMKPQNRRGRYALTVVLFYAFAFCFGGGLVAIFEAFGVEYYMAEHGGILTNVPIGGMVASLAIFVGLAKWGIGKVYVRKRQRECIFLCEVAVGEQVVKMDGFMDTGNTAQYEGKAVCFVSPEILFQLFELKKPEKRMRIRTISGEKEVGLFAVDEVRIMDEKVPKTLKNPYLSPAVHIIGKEYKILLPRL